MQANDERALFEVAAKQIKGWCATWDHQRQRYDDVSMDDLFVLWQAARKPAPAEPVAFTLPQNIQEQNGPWCREALLYSPDNQGDSPEKRVPLYLAAPRAENPVLPVAPDGWVLVPRQVVQDVCTLAHNYSLNAIAPDYYHGVERDAFANAYKRCGSDLAKIRAALAALPSSPEPRE